MLVKRGDLDGKKNFRSRAAYQQVEAPLDSRESSAGRVSILDPILIYFDIRPLGAFYEPE